jgi:hypothetical protein
MHKITIILIAMIASIFMSNSYAHQYKDYVLNCIDIVNEKRESRPFLKPYKSDPELQERAELIVLEMATLRHKGHLNRRQRGDEYTFYPLAKCEGVGWGGKDITGENFHTCYLYDRSIEYVGCAMAIGTDGTTYYCLIGR